MSSFAVLGQDTRREFGAEVFHIVHIEAAVLEHLFFKHVQRLCGQEIVEQEKLSTAGVDFDELAVGLDAYHSWL